MREKVLQRLLKEEHQSCKSPNLAEDAEEQYSIPLNQECIKPGGSCPVEARPDEFSARLPLSPSVSCDWFASALLFLAPARMSRSQRLVNPGALPRSPPVGLPSGDSLGDLYAT